jgi:hypothetical protein
VIRASLIVLLVAVPGGSALAFAIVDSSLTISNLMIKPVSGTASFETPLTTSATTHAFNSLGEDVSDGNTSSIGTDVTANAVVTFAQGAANALVSNNSVFAKASVNIPGGGVLAGVNVPGSDGDLSGNFDINGASTTNPINVTFSMQVTGSLHGVSDAMGFLQNGDLTAELDIDGTPVLFDLESLPGLSSTAGVNNYPDTTCTIPPDTTCRIVSVTSATISLDPTVPHFFDLHADAEAQALNIAEPGSLSLLLAGLGALAWLGALMRYEQTNTDRHG